MLLKEEHFEHGEIALHFCQTVRECFLQILASGKFCIFSFLPYWFSTDRQSMQNQKGMTWTSATAAF